MNLVFKNSSNKSITFNMMQKLAKLKMYYDCDIYNPDS